MGEALDFLTALYGAAPDHARVVLWTKAKKRSQNFLASADGLAAAAAFAEEQREDVYVHVSLAAQDVPAKNRIKNESSAGIAGLWADIDIVGGPDGKTGVAPSLQVAAEVAASIAVPTLTITSGYGLQAFWLLEEEPWVFGDESERHRAVDLAAAWIRLVRKACLAEGFTIDAVQDLARLMRVPGTLNTKGKASGHEPAMARGWPEPVAEQDGPRYELHTLLEIASRAPAPTTGPSAGSGAAGGLSGRIVVRRDAAPPMDKLEAMRENSQIFDQTWRHQRREQSAKDWSLSEYDLALCSYAVQAEWEDQELADLIIAHRRKYGTADDVEKGLRLDYLQRTIAKSRLESRRAERDRDRTDALDELAEVADTGEGDPDRVLSAFNRIVGGPVIKELVQDGRDPEMATFELVMANADIVRLGSAQNLVSQDRFRERFMVVTARLLPKVKADEWTDAVNALMLTRQLRESSDDTPEGTVLEWLRRYLFERMAEHADVDESARLREPFVRGDEVFVFAQGFAAWVRSALRTRIEDAQIRVMLRHAGFERRPVNYHRNGQEGRRSSASYYAADRRVVE